MAVKIKKPVLDLSFPLLTSCCKWVGEPEKVSSSSIEITLKALRRRMQRRTDIPKGGITFAMVRVISRMEVITTKKSKRLKRGIK